MPAAHALAGPISQGILTPSRTPRYRSVSEPTQSTVLELSRTVLQFHYRYWEQNILAVESKTLMGAYPTVHVNRDIQVTAIKIPITELPSPYRVIKPILIDVELHSKTEAIAHLKDVGIAMSGDDYTDAFENIQAFILDCLDDWKTMAPEQLGPIPTEQFAKLREYVEWI